MYSDYVNLECWETIIFWAEQTENIEKEHLEKGTEGLIQDLFQTYPFLMIMLFY